MVSKFSCDDDHFSLNSGRHDVPTDGSVSLSHSGQEFALRIRSGGLTAGYQRWDVKQGAWITPSRCVCSLDRELLFREQRVEVQRILPGQSQGPLGLSSPILTSQLYLAISEGVVSR